MIGQCVKFHCQAHGGNVGRFVRFFPAKRGEGFHRRCHVSESKNDLTRHLPFGSY